jgi:uncharacterized protein (TIRG00374 family)
MKKNLILSLIVSLCLSAGGLYLAFRNVPLKTLFAYFATINYWWALPACVLAVLSFIFRVLRWRIIVASTRPLDFWSAFHPLMIAFMINAILPGRVGEIARPVILKKKEKIPFATGLATVAAERAFDISLIILMFMVVLMFVNIDPNIYISFGKYQLNESTLKTLSRGMVQLSLLMVAGMVLISFQTIRNRIAAIVLMVPRLFFFASEDFKRKIHHHICLSMLRMMENFASGFKLITSPLQLALCVFLSVLIWALAALSYHVFSLGCPGVVLSIPEMTAVMVIICIFIALPSVPGYWGLWEAGGMFAMALFGVPSQEAAGFTLANHAIQLFPIIIIGMISAVLTGVNILKTSYGDSPAGD